MSPKKIKIAVKTIIVLGALFLVGCSAWIFNEESISSHEKTIALLVPDNHDAAAIEIWKQAASEEGVRLEVLTASSFLRPFDFFRKTYVGIVVPDSIHRSANDILTDRLKQYVSGGGKLMLVYDALTLDLTNTFPAEKSRLSEMVGVDYAFYTRLGEKTTVRDAVGGTADSMRRIGVTPGRFSVENPLPFGEHIIDRWLTTYHYDKLEYPFFVTGSATSSANVLLIGANGSVAAMENSFGSGKSLFVNLPLGFLKNRTDGLLLHAFLRYFSDDIVGLPRLLNSPGGVGGMVLNIHVDSGEAIPNLDVMDRIGVFEQGPYSIHFTAGPDVNQPGDGLGMNVEHNAAAQGWIRRLAAGKHVIGNHGGWIHNYFSENLTEDNQADFEKYLILNDNAMTKITGKPIVEYAAPNGNHPAWVTEWLVRQKALAYYTTANGGTGPTRFVDRNGVVDKRIWSVPVTPFGRIASFEEAMFSGLSHKAIAGWLNDVSNYVADSKNIRLIYCHPLGVSFYADSVSSWLKTTRSLTRNKVFKWYTMTEVAQFMSRRELTTWSFDSANGKARLSANHPESLKDMTWMIPKKQCEMPVIVQGQGAIVSYPGSWQITSSDGRELQATCAIPGIEHFATAGN